MTSAFAMFLLASAASASNVDMNANPIRKVVTLMETMQAKINAEAKKEDQLFDKFECYCKKTQKQLEDDIARAVAIGNVKPEDIAAKEAQLEKLQLAVQDLKSEKTEEDETLAAAKAARDKQHQEHMQDEKDQADTEGAAEGALKSLKQNQTDADKLPQHQPVANPSSFLAQKTGLIQSMGGVVPGEATAYIKRIEEDSEEAWRKEIADDKEGAGLFENMKSSKSKSIKTVLNMMAKKAKKVGELKVEIVNMKHMMKGGAKTLAENQKMLAELKKDCAERAKEQDEKKALRADEEKALQDTIKMLSDDDALDLFKKTIKQPSLLQLGTTREQACDKARNIVNKLRALGSSSNSSPELSFIAMALSGKNVDFTKVFKQIDGMISLLGKEGADDESKKEYCRNGFNGAADKAKELKNKISELSASVKEKQAETERITAEIKATNEGVRSLDESMAQATENRKAESADFQELLQQDSAAINLLGMAKDRLNQFYNPKLAKVTTTPNPYDAYALVSLHQHQAEAGTPGSNGVLSLISTMVSDLEKEMAVAKVEEKTSQKEYEATVADAKEKRESDLKDAQQKAGVKADLESDSDEDAQEKSSTVKEQQATMKFAENLHKQCDWLVKNFDLRAEARGEEIENLKRAKAVLSGADFSLLQVASPRHLRGH